MEMTQTSIDNDFTSNSSNGEDNGPPELFCASSMAVLEDSCATAQSCKNEPCPSNQFCFPYTCAATISHTNVATATTSSPKPTVQTASASQKDLQSSTSAQLPELVNGNILGKANTCLCGEAYLDPKAKVFFAGEEVSCHELESTILVKGGNFWSRKETLCSQQSSYSTTCCVDAFHRATDEKASENALDGAADGENILGPCNLCQSNGTPFDMKESAQVSYNGEVQTCLEVNQSLNTRREQSNQHCTDVPILLFEQCCETVDTATNSMRTRSPETYLWFTSAASSNINSTRNFRFLLIAGLLFMRSSFGGL